MDLFDVSSVDLSELTKVVMRHDQWMPGEGLYVNKVIIRESENPAKQWCFPCDR